MAKAEKHSFTHEYINGLAPRQKNYEVEDTRVSGLRCRVSPKGVKTFFVYKKVSKQTELHFRRQIWSDVT